MDVAYLIAVHTAPRHLARLVDRLQGDGVAFFIHVDGKVPLAPFTECLPAGGNVHYVHPRLPVWWAGFSQVETTLTLLRAAKRMGQAFRYYALLTGSCYPIKPRSDIVETYRASDTEFIRIDRKLERHGFGPHVDYITRRWWFMDSRALNPRTARWRGALRARALLDRASRKLPKRRFPLRMSAYHGNAMWSLTAPCVDYILDFVNTNPGYVQFHRWVRSADEIFFHSIVKSSRFADKISHDFERDGPPDHQEHGNHYIDWTASSAQRGCVLDSRDLDSLLSSNVGFARKFDPTKSRELIDTIDAAVHDSPEALTR